MLFLPLNVYFDVYKLGPLGLALVVKRYLASKSAVVKSTQPYSERIYNFMKTQTFVRILNNKLVGQ